MIKAAFEARAQAKKDNKKAEKLLSEADAILREVDEAHIFKVSRPRQFPAFERSELKFGHVLGVGGFCLVREVTQIKPPPTKPGQQHELQIITEPSPADSPEEEHYDVTTAKIRMSKYCLRDGDARYAVKQLHADLTPLENARGMVDLAIEAKYLGSVSHPSIIKLRGVASVGPMDQNFFLVLDRLYGTLEERLETWQQEKGEHTGLKSRFGSSKDTLKKLRIERLLVAYDIAAAVRYLHENKIVFRDIKSENIGFDVRGDAKLFDFGLAKSLYPKLKMGTEGMYLLTPRTGSLPYMAPEVSQGKPYGLSADVFSFSMLLYEILALRQPFKGFSRRELYEKISIQGLRPSIHSSWPAMTKMIMREGWNGKPKERPDMRRMAALLRADLNNLSADPEVRDRTKHMKQRSLRSMHHRGTNASRKMLSTTEHGGVPHTRNQMVSEERSEGHTGTVILDGESD